MPKLKSFTIKKNELVILKEAFRPISEKEQFYVIQGSNNLEDFTKLKEVLEKFAILYKYKGIKSGFHNYSIWVRRLTDDKEIMFPYIGLTDHADNPLTLQSILYEIAEIYCSDETNPCWDNDKKIKAKVQNMFTDKEIEVFPTELI